MLYIWTRIQIWGNWLPSLTFTINILLSIFLGSLLAIAFAIVSEMLDRRVRSADDLAQLLGLPVLGDISTNIKTKSNFAQKLQRLFNNLFSKLSARSAANSLRFDHSWREEPQDGED